MKNQNILFFTRTMKLGGTENVVLQLCEIFQPYVKQIIVCSCGGINTKQLERMGIKHYEIPDIESKNPKTIMEVSKKVRKIVKDEKITIIHTHHRMAAFYVAMLRLYKGCHFINTVHNTFTDKVVLTRFAYKNANLIACGTMVKKNLVEIFGFQAEKVAVIHNAVKSYDKEVIDDPLLRELHEQGYFIIGNIGRLSEQKGMEYYIQSIPEILDSCPNTRFLIIGNGELEERLKQLVEKLQIDEKVFFLGYREDVQNLMQQLDLVVLSSLWEGLPLTPIEAFSVKKTIVATAVDGTIEIVKDGVNGLLVSPKNVSQLSQAVKKLVLSDTLKETFEDNAKQTYDTAFSFERLAKAYLSYYENCCLIK